MNHKWKNDGKWGDVKDKNENWIRVKNPKICVRCGLQKAIVIKNKGDFQPYKSLFTTIYYKSKIEILSGRIPFECDEGFITKEDFHV